MFCFCWGTGNYQKVLGEVVLGGGNKVNRAPEEKEQMIRSFSTLCLCGCLIWEHFVTFDTMNMTWLTGTESPAPEFPVRTDAAAAGSGPVWPWGDPAAPAQTPCCPLHRLGVAEKKTVRQGKKTTVQLLSCLSHFQHHCSMKNTNNWKQHILFGAPTFYYLKRGKNT